jgi:hypothetical protein
MPLPDAVQSEPLVITLIHGTFARQAEWTAPQSKLCKAVPSLVGVPIVFRVFPWSGENSHRARMKGASSLARYIRQGLRLYPNSKHVTIAHSHGGNISLYAMRDALARERTSGIVCLGTPFISGKVRDLRNTFNLMQYLLPSLVLLVSALVSLLPMAIVSSLVEDIPRGGLLHWVLRLVALLTLAGVIALPVKAWLHLRGSVRDEMEQRAIRLADWFSPPLAIHVPTLCISAKMDEAHLWLSAMHWVANLPHTIWKISYWFLVCIALYILAGC